MDGPQDGSGELLLPADVSLPERRPGFVTISLFTRPVIRHDLHDERLGPVRPSSRSLRPSPATGATGASRRPGPTAGAVT
ncbi:hypothetical protein M2167_006157 [Streptomyces sp. SPB4]|nr:hypothetical protein [Streptomyces sp. SPB4]